MWCFYFTFLFDVALRHMQYNRIIKKQQHRNREREHSILLNCKTGVENKENTIKLEIMANSNLC